MSNKQIYITINHLSDYGGSETFRVGHILTLVKDWDNCFDDEAIAVYNQYGCLCGYVANSTTTVCRGTYSAGRVYDQFDDTIQCMIQFIAEELLIALIV